MTCNREAGILAAILVAFVALGATYSIVVPPFEASDELWHYPMVRHIAETGSLPVQDPANVGPWRQEGSQPPLYYAVGALATFWIDTSDMDQVRHLNLHVDNGIATPDGNVNLVVHRPEREAFPWRGTVLAIHILRFLSVIMAATGVALTYWIVKQVFPGRPSLAVGATAIHAFTPMVVFIAGSVNNDNLVVPISGLALLMLLRLLRVDPKDCTRSSWAVARRYLVLGLILGLAALTKASSLGLTVLTAVVVVVRTLRQRAPADARKEFLIGGFATLLPLIAVAGWWYLRNLRLYGDPTGLNAFIEILGKREIPATLAQLWRERSSFLAGYWGNFGGLNVPMSPWIYQVLNGILVLAGLGLVIIPLRSLVTARSPKHQTDSSPKCPEEGSSPTAHEATTEVSSLGVWILPLGLCVLWALLVLVPWVQWTRVTWSSQGRLVFAALPVWSLLLALGASAWWPHRWRWGPGVAPSPPIIGLVLFLLSLSLAAPFVWIQPAYAHPAPLSDAQVRAIPESTDITLDQAMRLLGYELSTRSTRPGGGVELTLYWEALARTEEDQTVFVHLLDEHDLVIAQRDTFPGLGLLSTTWLDPGYRWADRYVIPIPRTAYAPNQTQIEMGLFNSRTGVRMTVLGPDGVPAGDNARFGHVTVEARSGDVPNPISVDFGGQMLLRGYDLSERAVQPGEHLTLTLYWEALRSMDTNYTVSSQIIDGSQRKAAQNDRWPKGGAAPTAAWEPRSIIADSVPLTVFPDAAGGSYEVRVAVYVHQDDGIEHLPVTPPGGQMQASHISLTKIRVAPGSP